MRVALVVAVLEVACYCYHVTVMAPPVIILCLTAAPVIIVTMDGIGMRQCPYLLKVITNQ